MKLKYLVLAAATSLVLSACQPGDKPAEGATTPAAADAAAAPAATTDTATIDAGTGVPECDQYLEKVYACVADKIPAEQRDLIKQGIDQSKAGWASMADKSALAAQCKTAMDQAKQAYGAMGCSF